MSSLKTVIKILLLCSCYWVILYHLTRHFEVSNRAITYSKWSYLYYFLLPSIWGDWLASISDRDTWTQNESQTRRQPIAILSFLSRCFRPLQVFLFAWKGVFINCVWLNTDAEIAVRYCPFNTSLPIKNKL